MVTLLHNFPPHVAAYRAQGSVNKEEYKDVVMHRVDEVAASYPLINFFVLLETGFEEYSFMAFVEYVKVSFEHFTKWNRMAIISDQKWVRKAYDLLSPLVHGEIRTYRIEDQELAREWVSAPLET
ncbi:STAS/SEC14 domain-containing protein [Olivibacter sp. XZL3]|uniref:STAS/SEC14 domain-containing protein n=1 Tax=Olivibacter sp. XZL3 TaxID=1735116 RepID=UPI0010647A45|nr:STAS/SEC14 domain-containing protein [Olivibacter sp. XZL3]